MDASLAVPARRTRKRFTNVQLTMLENLFHQNSHPSRADREALARAGAMETKSVTIWFQNKRQTERRSAASTTPHAVSFNHHNVHPNVTSTIHTFSLHASHPLPSPPLAPARPSLDRVASRSELRTPSSHTPSHTRPHSPRRLSSFPPAHIPSAHHPRQLYDHLPSSPLYPTSPTTPSTRDFLDFAKSSSNAKTRRTLEWACEAARVADKDRDRDKDRARPVPCCPSLNTGNHRHHAHHAHQMPHHHAYASTEAITTSRTYAPARARDRAARDRLARPSSSLTLRGKGSLTSVSSSRAYTPRGDMTDSEGEEDHEAITPPSPSISNRWTARLSKSLTDTSLTSSSSTSTTPSTISREGSTTSTNTSFTSSTGVPEDDAMFKAAIALCGLGRMGQNSMQRRA